MNYILVGRDIETLRQQLTKQERYERELPKAPCIFCGETISHFNDGGVGWCLGAIVDGQSRSYLYCDQPPCVKAQEFCWEIWRCGCIPDYVESVGEFCNSCRRPRRDALP